MKNNLKKWEKLQFFDENDIVFVFKGQFEWVKIHIYATTESVQ